MLYMTTLLVLSLVISTEPYLHILSALKFSVPFQAVVHKACSEYHYTSLLTMLMSRTCHIPYKIRKWDCTPINDPIMRTCYTIDH